MATPNLNLDLPVVTVTLGPTWATKLNESLEVIDNHDHSTGKGVKIKPSGLNINTDLDIQTNNLNNVLAARLAEQAAIPNGAADVRSLYSFGGNLYYNNDNGDPVRITDGTAIDASSVGAIGGDYGTTSASVTYNNTAKTYSFNTDTDRKGALDAGAITIRETDVLNSNSVTLLAPAALAASYSATLPAAVPPSTQLLTMNNSGVLEFADTDEASLETTGAGILRIKDLGVTTAKLDNSAVTNAKIADGVVGSTKLGSQSVDNSKIATNAVTATKTDVRTGLQAIIPFSTNGGSISITTPVAIQNLQIMFNGADGYFVGNGNAGSFTAWSWTGPTGVFASGLVANQFGTNSVTTPLSAFNTVFLGTAPAGTYTFQINTGSVPGGQINYMGFLAV